MKPKNFEQKVETHLNRGRLFPPVVGTLGSMQVAATLIRDEKYDTRGVMLLANSDPQSDKCLKIKSEIGGFTLGHYDACRGMPWSTEVFIIVERLRELFDQFEISSFSNIVPRDHVFEPTDIIGLTFTDPGAARDSVPTINGIGLDSFGLLW